MRYLIMHLLAETEGDLQAPLELRRPVEALQCIHAGVPVTAIDVTVAEDRLQRQLATVVTVA